MRTFDNKLRNSMLKFANIHNNNARIWLCLSFDLLFAFDPLKIINIFFRKDWFILWLALILIIISCCDSVCITSVYADYGQVCFAFDFQQFLANLKKNIYIYTTSLPVFVRPSNRNYQHWRCYSVCVFSVILLFI